MNTSLFKGLSVVAATTVAAALLVLVVAPSFAQSTAVSFGKSLLQNETSGRPTSLQFGPDGRLYAAQQNGFIKVYTVQRAGANNYSVTSSETIDLVKKIPNHDDNGSLNTTQINRQITGIVVAGTASNPIIYASSSDPRIGAGSDGTGDINLDTNSGVVSKLTWDGTKWNKVDLVRGLPRSEENHSVNGMQLSADGTKLYLAVGGNTNKGAPSDNFALLPEFALSAAILEIDLAAIGNSTHDLSTLNDENRAGNPDANDPFGGNDGKNQAVADSKVKVYSSGYRNPYDLVVTGSGRMYTVDNGGNAGWGDVPVGEGPNGACTNAANELGTTDEDSLHFVNGAGYYGGHPNPTRANTANTFNPSNPQSPVSVANPIECDYRANGAEKGSLTTFPASTNGIDEYTASNFGGAMKGDLVAASFDNKIYRVELNAAGDAVASKEALISNVGSVPLDVTTQGDGGPFPGTMWVGDIQAGNIVVFEPADGGASSCTGADDPNLDEDSDGFDNADELDNGTSPCSAADLPPDADGDKTSDLNDPDDDNDTRPDTSDPFAVDAQNGKTTNLPVSYTWDNEDSGSTSAGGLMNLGFTGLMTNKTSDYESLYDPANMTAGGAAGVTTIDKVPEGDAKGATNTQQYGFQFGVNATPTTGLFTAHTRIAAPFAGMTPQDFQSMGLFIGNGDQDNYAKIVTAANGGQGGVQFAREENGSFSAGSQANVTMPGPDAVDLYLTVDPAANTVQPSYRTITNGVAGPRTNLGGTTSVPSGWFGGTTGLAVGMVSTSSGAAPEFPATWDFIEVVPGNANTTSTSEAHLAISHGSARTIQTGSIYTSNTFKLKNNSPSGQKITSLSIDTRPAVLMDQVFDPMGTAGDDVGKCFTADTGGSGAAAVGLATPADPCSSPFGSPHDGGYDVLSLSFNDFGPGEQFNFSVDGDPTSINGVNDPGPNHAGSVSGLELSGAKVTVGFNDGSSYTTEPYRIPGSPHSSQNTLKANQPSRPNIEVLGVTAPSTVTNPSQTVRVNGPAGSSVSLMVLEGGLFTAGVPNGGFDLDPYEANTAIAVSEKAAQIGPEGHVDVPVTLTRTDATDGGLNHIVAVTKDASGRTSSLSNKIVLELRSLDTTPPETTITSGPSGTTPSTDAQFAFSSSEANSAFECSLDGAAFAVCSSPKSYTGLSNSSHTFEVRAVDASGNVDATPAGRTWTVDTTATGSGLTGQYYDNKDFTNLKLTRTDPKIDFDWGNGSPDPSIDANTFSVRWSGQIKADHTQTYTFYTTANDGVRLWVGGKQIIDRWKNGSKTDTGTIALEAGKWYPITLEYFDGQKAAHAKLEYSSPSTARQVVPADHLLP